MTSPVVLALNTSLDLAAARRLADYGDLDDAGVTRALEQVCVQREGHIELPDYLRRIDTLAALVDEGGHLRLIQPGHGTERERLSALFACWPEAERVWVDWQGRSHDLLMTRALINETVVPPAFDPRQRCVLADYYAPASLANPMASEQAEQECLSLMGGQDSASKALNRAAGRYRLWLRWQYCTGRIDHDTKSANETRLARLLAEVAP